MGGLLTHAASLCAITNPSTNSYKRLVPGFEAPVTIGYAMSNRSAVIRIPAYAKKPDVKRFELCNPDATCNPYYAYAAILMAGPDGIQKKIAGLHTSLSEALDALEADHDYLTAGGVFPERLLKQYVARRKDVEEINILPHPAEFAKYYDL